jgi:hypothetical protein
MTAVNEVLDDLKRVLSARMERLAPEERAAFEAGSLSEIWQFIRSLQRVPFAHPSGPSSEVDPAWWELQARAETEYERASREERVARRKDLESPSDESTYIKALWWQGEHGGEDELAIVRRQRLAPPFSTADALVLLKITEQKISDRLSRPLPEPVRQSADFYLRFKLGDALTAARSGAFVSGAEGGPAWLVTVYYRQTSEVRGELRISEDGKKVEWTPARKT